MNHIRARQIMWILIVVGVVAIVSGLYEKSQLAFYGLLIGGVLCIIGGLLLGFLRIKCPHCNCSLMDFRIDPPDKCPHCGEKLD